MSRKAIYPGTFDPLTNGHVDLIRRASRIFDHVVVAVADSTSKNTLFTTQERIALAQEALSDLYNVSVVSFNRLMTDSAREHGAMIIIRGLRSGADFEYEFQMAGMNRKLFPQAETIFMTPDEKLTCISSSLVREIAKLKGDVSEFVPDNVFEALQEKFS